VRSSYHREIIGLDVGIHSVKAVRATPSYKGVNLHESERVRMPGDGAQRREVLQALVEEKGWRGLPCIVAVPDDAVVLQILSVPEASDRAMRDAIRSEIRELHEMSPGQTTHTWMRQGKDYRHVLLAAARLESVMAVFELAASAGLEVVDVVSGTAAMHRALTSVKRAGLPVCIDIGHEGCNVAIGPRGRVEFARHVGSGFTALRPDSAGQNGDDATGNGPSLTTWLDELKHTLELHRTRVHAAAAEPTHIILCGGGARDASLGAAIQEALGLETLCYGSLGPSQKIADADVFATSVGLATVGLEDAKLRPSVLPPAMRERLGLRGQMKYWYATAVAVVCAAAVLTFGLELKLRTGKAQLALLESQQAEQKLLLRNLSLVRGLNRNLDTQIHPFRLAIHNGTIIRAVIEAIADTKHEDDWFILLADAVAYGMGDPEVAAGGASFARPVTRLIIEGCTPDSDLGSVRSMIDQLRERPGIVSADLLSDDLLREDPERDDRWAATGARIFAIEITMPEP
jgi:Tfp pilus assembly PilM family ATPase